MKKFLLFFFLVFSLEGFSQANPAVIFNQGYGKILPEFGLRFKDLKTAISGSDDPSATATDAPIGSLYISSNGGLYQKQDNGATTNWTRFYIFPSFANDNRLVKTDGTDDIQETGIIVSDANDISNVNDFSYLDTLFTPLATQRVAVIDVTSALSVSSVTVAELEAFSGDIGDKLAKFPAETNDNRIARTDVNGNALQGSAVSIDDSGVVNGVTQLNIDDLRLDGSTLSTTTFATDLNLTASGDNINALKTLQTESIVVSSGNTVDVDGMLINASSITSSSDLALGATGDISIDTVTANQVVFADGTVAITGDADFLYDSSLNKLRAASLDFEGATIESVGTDQDISLIPNGTGEIDLDKNTNVTGELVVTGLAQVDNVQVNGNTISSLNTDGNISINPNGTGEINLDKNTNITGELLVTGLAQIDNLLIDGNEISSTDTNGNISINPNGTGEISLEKTTNIADDLNVINTSRLGDITIASNLISSSNTDADLDLSPNGTGVIKASYDSAATTQDLDTQITAGNLIANESFERSDISGVVCTNATLVRVASMTGGENNQHALQVTSTGTDWSCDITGGASAGQGALSAEIKTDESDETSICLFADSVEQICSDKFSASAIPTNYSMPIVLGATANAFRIKGSLSGTVSVIDKVFVGAKALDTTSVDTEWREYTPTFTGLTTTGVECYWRRVGTNAEINCEFGITGNSAVTAQVGLPSGLIVSNSIPTGSAILGRASRFGSASTYLKDLTVIASRGDSTLKLGAMDNADTLDPGVPLLGNQLSVTIMIHASVPIQGWLSSSQAFSRGCQGLECVNEFSARYDNAEATLSLAVKGQNVAFITNTAKSGTSNFEKTFTVLSGTFGAAPNCVASGAGGAGVNYLKTSSSATSLRFDTVIAATDTASDASFNFICSRSTDYKQQARITGVVGEHNIYDGVERISGDTYSGETVYKRCYEVTSDITTTTTIATIPSGLEPISSVQYGVGLWVILSGVGTSTQFSWINYNSTSGVIQAVVDTARVGEGTNFCFKYRKP